MQNRQYRQGDVLLERVAQLPRDAKPVPGRAILAEGELTGHCHEIRSGAQMFQTIDGQRFVMITDVAQLTHQEHTALDIEPGVYRVLRQREYTPEQIRQVAD